MLSKPLGRCGIEIPEVGIGTYAYKAGPGPLRRILETGCVWIDTAESYGTETVIGEAIRGMRDRAFLATKISPDHFREDDCRKAVEGSMRRLNVDVLDLVQLHYPNPDIPIEETMGTLTALIDAGKVRFCGVSNFSVQQLQEAQKAATRHPIVSNQVRYNLIHRNIESGLLQYCQAQQITIIAYSPLATSLIRILDCDSAGTIAEIARTTGKSPAQIAINWCISHENVVAIPRGGSLQHLIENGDASDWRLTSGQMALLDSTIRPRHRSTLDRWARRLVPQSLQQMAVRGVQQLPRGIRGRLL
jgi:diketogulonate reductase-like aldo/keto reductase